MTTRCAWSHHHPLMIQYHDEEWGVPVHDDRKLFEYTLLDAMQAVMYWLTFLLRREGFRRAFDNFEPGVVAAYGEEDVQRLLADPGIIRNRLKVRAAVTNAQRFLEGQREFGSFDAYVWGFVGGATIRHGFAALFEVPARSGESDAMSRDLSRRGFKFVGSVICYAFMQAAGLVNDHTTDCFRYGQV